MTLPAAPSVFDCNIFFQALISPTGPAAECVLAAARGQVLLYCSEHIVAEVRDVASRVKLRKKFGITDERVERLIETIREAATFVENVPEEYLHAVDPDDSHYVNLALATRARLLVSRDDDLLRLMDADRAEGIEFQRRFPGLRILTPEPFLREIGVPTRRPDADQ